MSKLNRSVIFICFLFFSTAIHAIDFHGTGAGTTYDSVYLEKFDKSIALNKYVAPFYITVSIKQGACTTESFLNYKQIPVIIMNYACNITGCNSKGIIYTTAGDVNNHYYYAVKDAHFSKNTISRVEVFVLWPGCNIKITKFKPVEILKVNSEFTSNIPAHKFKINTPAPHYSGKYRKLIPFTS